jgi:predicted Zn-dependent protease
VVGLAPIVLVTAGCGSGRLSVVDFDAKASAICAKYNAKVRSAYTNVPPDPVSLTRAIRKAIAYTKKGAEELDAVNPPKMYDSQFKEFVRITYDEVAAGKELAKAAETRNQAQLAAARTKLVLQGRNADRLARGMGLNACAQH